MTDYMNTSFTHRDVSLQKLSNSSEFNFKKTISPSPRQDIWSLGNKGVLIKGEQKLTHQKLLSALRKDKKALNAEEEARLRKACQDFESFFVYYLLKNMDETVPRDKSILGKSRSQQFYREMFYENLADDISRRGIGLADTMYNQMRQFLLHKLYK